MHQMGIREQFRHHSTSLYTKSAFLRYRIDQLFEPCGMIHACPIVNQNSTRFKNTHDISINSFTFPHLKDKVVTTGKT